MAGTPLRNLSMFDKLCGRDALRNVILATTMWSDVEEQIALVREEDLRTQYWRSMIILGSRMARFGYTHESAWDIVNSFSGIRHPLQIQVEMVDKGIELPYTAAGFTLFQWLGELITRFRRILDAIEARLRRNARSGDLEDTAAIVQEKSAVKRQLDQAKKQKQKLNRRKEKRQVSAVVKNLMQTSRPSTPASILGSSSESSACLLTVRSRQLHPTFSHIT
jgi:hypothetical protein